jgi:hypothetical protein
VRELDSKTMGPTLLCEGEEGDHFGVEMGLEEEDRGT